MNPFMSYNSFSIISEQPTVAPIVYKDGKAMRRERRAKQRRNS